MLQVESPGSGTTHLGDPGQGASPSWPLFSHLSNGIIRVHTSERVFVKTNGRMHINNYNIIVIIALTI